MLPRSFQDFRPFPPCQMQLCVVATLSKHECVGASVTSAEFRRALRLWCESDTDTLLDGAGSDGMMCLLTCGW